MDCASKALLWAAHPNVKDGSRFQSPVNFLLQSHGVALLATH